MKKRNCRMTGNEKEIHDRAVKIRKMTDEQLCRYIDGLKSSAPPAEDKSIGRFLALISNTKGIGIVTERKLYALARDEGFIE